MEKHESLVNKIETNEDNEIKESTDLTKSLERNEQLPKSEMISYDTSLEILKHAKSLSELYDTNKEKDIRRKLDDEFPENYEEGNDITIDTLYKIAEEAWKVPKEFIDQAREKLRPLSELEKLQDVLKARGRVTKVQTKQKYITAFVRDIRKCLESRYDPNRLKVDKLHTMDVFNFIRVTKEKNLKRNFLERILHMNKEIVNEENLGQFSFPYNDIGETRVISNSPEFTRLCYDKIKELSLKFGLNNDFTITYELDLEGVADRKYPGISLNDLDRK